MITIITALFPHQFPLDMDVVIDMTEDGVRLLFDPKNQRLKVGTCSKPQCLIVRDTP